MHKKIMGPWPLLLILCYCCNKETSRETLGTNNSSSLSSPLLVKATSVWSPGDSTTTTYQYDPQNQLVASQNNIAGNNFTYYQRDAQERITTLLWVSGGDSSFENATYQNPGSPLIAYTRGQSKSSGNIYQDSCVYFYNPQNHVGKIAFYALNTSSVLPGSYDSFTYDITGNLTQLQLFIIDSTGQYSLNIAYQFQYDNKTNPLYSQDDIRLPYEWYLSNSPNNLVKQTNVYGVPPSSLSNYITLSYQYQSYGEPSQSTENGTAIAQTVQTYYYYK